MSKIGILTPLYAAAPKVDRGILVSLMAEFCRAGGRVTISEWLAMSVDERDALVEAKSEVFTETLELLAGSMTPDADDVAEKIAAGLAGK